MDLQTRDHDRRPDTLVPLLIGGRKGIPGIAAFPFPPHGRSIDGGSKWLRSGRVNSNNGKDPPPTGEEVCLLLGQMEFHVLIAGGRTEQLIPQFGRSWFRASGMTISPLSALSRLTYRSDRRDRQGAVRKTGQPRAHGGRGSRGSRLLPRRAEVEVIANSSY